MKRLFYIPLILIAIVLCIRLVHEPDLWWQLRTGEYILETGEIPDSDVFSFTYEGVDWLNVKWGYEMVQAVTSNLFGPEFLFIPQIVSNLLLLLVLLLLLREIRTMLPISQSVKVIALLVFLVGMSYRMNGRPELVTYTFTAFYLFVLTSVQNGKQRWLFALLPAQILWTNMHEAYGVGMVMTGIFLASSWFHFISTKPKGSLAKKAQWRTTAIIVASWLVTAIHPSGVQMIWHPYDIFTQLSDNQFTQEIYSAANKAYWQLPAFVGLGVGIIGLIHLYRQGRVMSKFRITQLLTAYPLFYVLLFLAFFYLSLKSYRNLPFLLIIATPFAAIQIHEWLSGIKERLLVIVAFSFSLLLYFSIVSNAFYKSILPAEQYGVGINPAKNPIGASNFIKEHDLADGKAFTDYLISSYYLWDLQPEFKTFVDLRDLDVFEAEDIEISLILCNQPDRRLAGGQTIWDAIDQRNQFAYVSVLNNPQFLPLQRHLLANTDYELVFADELSAVFVPQSNSKVIRQTILNEKYQVFQPIPAMSQPTSARLVSQIFWPFYEAESYSIEKFESSKQAYFRSIGMNSR